MAKTQFLSAKDVAMFSYEEGKEEYVLGMTQPELTTVLVTRSNMFLFYFVDC